MEFNIRYEVLSSEWGKTVHDIKEVKMDSNDGILMSQQEDPYLRKPSFKNPRSGPTLFVGLYTYNNDIQLMFNIAEYNASMNLPGGVECPSMLQRVYLKHDEFRDIVKAEGSVNNMIFAIVSKFITTVKPFLYIEIHNPKTYKEMVTCRDNDAEGQIFTLNRWGYLSVN